MTNGRMLREQNSNVAEVGLLLHLSLPPFHSLCGKDGLGDGHGQPLAAHAKKGPAVPGGLSHDGTGGGRGVVLQVFVQLVLADEGLAAQVAGVRALARVDGLHVPLQVVAATEVLPAHVALVRLNARVG